MLNDFVGIPRDIFTNNDLNYRTQSLGMWICFLCSEAENHTIQITMSGLEGYVGLSLTKGDIYRLSRANLITYQEENNGLWSITLLKSLDERKA
jgi:hypothetical protein